VIQFTPGTQPTGVAAPNNPDGTTAAPGGAGTTNTIPFPAPTGTTGPVIQFTPGTRPTGGTVPDARTTTGAGTTTTTAPGTTITAPNTGTTTTAPGTGTTTTPNGGSFTITTPDGQVIDPTVQPNENPAPTR
jgi:hypothetical protein